VKAPLPTFLIIGAARNATRWLRFNLDQHPDVHAPPLDTGFFVDEERMNSLGHRWYREQFPDWNGQAHLGEASPVYLDWVHGPGLMAETIRKHLRGVNLIAIVDDPVLRFRSALRHHIRWGRVPADVDVEGFYNLMAERELAIAEVQAGMQGTSLRPYKSLFGDRLKTLFVEDIRRDPASAYREVLEHIGADPSFVPEGLAQPRFSDRSVVDVPMPSTKTHQLLYMWYRVDVEHLEELTGRDCSAWDPGADDDIPSTEELLGAMVVGMDTGRNA
jgi:hypothetical protein